eukprot:366504-Chlamydomonas_euryale.AAC.4
MRKRHWTIGRAAAPCKVGLWPLWLLLLFSRRPCARVALRPLRSAQTRPRPYDLLRATGPTFLPPPSFPPCAAHRSQAFIALKFAHLRLGRGRRIDVRPGRQKPLLLHLLLLLRCQRRRRRGRRGRRRLLCALPAIVRLLTGAACEGGRVEAVTAAEDVAGCPQRRRAHGGILAGAAEAAQQQSHGDHARPRRPAADVPLAGMAAAAAVAIAAAGRELLSRRGIWRFFAVNGRTSSRCDWVAVAADRRGVNREQRSLVAAAAQRTAAAVAVRLLAMSCTVHRRRSAANLPRVRTPPSRWSLQTVLEVRPAQCGSRCDPGAIGRLR